MTASDDVRTMLDILNTVGRISVFASKMIADTLARHPATSDAAVAKAVQGGLIGTITTDTTEGRELAAVCARVKHVRVAKGWPKGPQDFFERRRAEWLAMIEAVEAGDDIPTLHAEFKAWLTALAE